MLVGRGSMYSVYCPLWMSRRETRSVSMEPVHASPFLLPDGRFVQLPPVPGAWSQPSIRLRRTSESAPFFTRNSSPVDRALICADHPAHRAARVAPDVIASPTE